MAMAAAAPPTVPPRRPRPLPLCHLPLLLFLPLLLLRPAPTATADTSEQPIVAVAFLADSFTTDSFTADPPQLLTLGDALLLPGADGVQLAGSGPGTAGRLLLAQPVTMQTSHQYGKSCASFSTAFQFSMAPIAATGAGTGGGAASGSAGPGDGLAFALVPDNVSVEWGSLGLVSLEEMQAAAAGWVHPRRAAPAPAPGVVAVELDAFMDPEFLDPNDNHVGLDVDTLVSLATANASDAGVRLRSGRQACAWIDYDAFRKVVEVRLGPACASRPAVPLLAFDIDLRSLVPDRVFVGFSASSSAGWTAVRPRVHSWCFGSGSGEAGYPFRYCDFQRRPATAAPPGGAVEVVPVYRNVLAAKNALVPAPHDRHQHQIPQQESPADLDQLQDEDDRRPHNLTDTTSTQGGDSRHEHTAATSQLLPVDASQENSKRTTETAGKAAQVQQQQQQPKRQRKRAAGGGHSVVLMGSLFVALVSLAAFVSYKKYTAGVRERRSHFQDMFQQPGLFGYQELITTSGPRFA